MLTIRVAQLTSVSPDRLEECVEDRDGMLFTHVMYSGDRKFVPMLIIENQIQEAAKFKVPMSTILSIAYEKSSIMNASSSPAIKSATWTVGIKILKNLSNGRTAFKPGERQIQSLLAAFVQEPSIDPQWAVVGILRNEFILLNAGDCLIFVDQHAAHERIRLESFLMTLRSSTVKSNFHLTCGQPEKFVDVGFLFDEKGLCKSLPAIFEDCEESMLQEGINEMGSPEFHGEIGDILLDWIKMKACKGAIKFGDKLNHKQVKGLIQDLSGCKFPGICAHGRPSIQKIKLV